MEKTEYTFVTNEDLVCMILSDEDGLYTSLELELAQRVQMIIDHLESHGANT